MSTKQRDFVTPALDRLHELEDAHDLRSDASPLFTVAAKTDLTLIRRGDEAAFIKLMDRFKGEGVPRLAELRKSLDKHERRIMASHARRVGDGEYGLKRAKDGEVIVDETKAALPQIQMVEANLPEVIAQAESALVAAHADVFQTTGRLVHMFRHDGVEDIDNTEESLTDEERRKLPLRRAVGALMVGDIGARALLVKLAECGQWFKWSERRHDWVPAAPRIDYALHLIEQAAWKLRTLRGTIEAPTLRSTGSILQRPGYDGRSQLYFDAGGIVFPEVPDRPTRDHAKAALNLLIAIIKDFPFVYDDELSFDSASRSAALSAMLTGLVRRTLETAPAHAFDAPQAGSGKTKLTEIAAALVTGRKPTMISQGASPEEFNKRIFAAFRSGDPIIGVDNIDHPIESDELCTALTAPTAQGRILGESRTATVNTNALIMLNGNNLVFKGDMTDRTVICRLEPGVEDPKSRKFDREPVGYALANRPELVIAGLTVLRAHAMAGYPGLEGLRPSRFPDWDRVVRGALVWLGQSDPQRTADSLKVVDPERDELRTLIRAWEAAIGLKTKVTAKRLIDFAHTAAADFDDEDDEENLGEAIDLVLPRATTPKALGAYLSKVHNKIVGGRVVRMRPDTKSAAQFWLEEA